MEGNTHKNALLNAFILLMAAAGAFAVARYAHSFSGQVAAAFIGTGFLVAMVSWFQMRLEERERIEKLEFDELTRTAASATLFGERDSEAFPAQRSREQFERFFVPAITVIFLLLQGIGAWLLWQAFIRARAEPLHRPAVALAIFGVFFLVLFLLGRYSAGVARLRGDRLLRPSANHLLLSAYGCGLVVLTIVAAWAEFPAIDRYVALAGAVLLGLVAFEMLVGLVLEIYRPRVRGKRARILYESRLVGLLSHPEGLFTTAAHVLDYQFGFKVSETWFYKFLERAFGWLVLGQALILLLSSCLVFIEAGEEALLERFGAPVAGREILQPGLHVKLPWPIDRVHRFKTREVQTFNIGFVHEEEDEDGHAARPEEQVVLWTVSHYKEEFNLLVASRDGRTNLADGKKIPPVNLLSVSIPVQFQINNLRDWAYNHLQPARVLEQIGTREVVRYLVSVDLLEIMSTGRARAGEALRERIQREADARQLGVRILFVGLQDIHPPISVAASFEAVIGAKQRREAQKLAAQADAVATNAWALAEAVRLQRGAEAFRTNAVMASLARAAQFTNQIPAYRAAPTVFAQLVHAQTLNRASAGTKKIVLATTNTEEVVLLNVEDKLRPDILDLPLPAPTPPK